MRRNPYKNYLSIGYVRIVEDSRQEAIKVDLGYRKDIWFPRAAVEIDSNDFQITGEETFIREKLKEAQGHEIKRKPPIMIELAPHSWANDVCFGYDVKVFRDGCGNIPIETRVFIQKSQIEDGFAPLWLVKRTEKKAIENVIIEAEYIDDEFYVTGLRAKDEPRQQSTGGYGRRSVPRAAKFKR